MMQNPIIALRNAIGNRYVIIDEASLGMASVNTLGLERVIEGMLYPGSVEEVRQVVEIANQHGLKLHPISAGMNIGYGDRLPIGNGHYIVDLSRLKQIMLNDYTGLITIQAGVTQGELMAFLDAHTSRWYGDYSGIGPQGSIIGNTADGGFGISPLGYRRENIKDLEIVTGKGDILRTGTFPGLGPDLSGNFVQSNFGVITEITMKLNRVPQHFESFMLRIDSDENLFEVLEVLKDLRDEGIVLTLGRVFSALRTLVTFQDVPRGYENILINNHEARKLLGEDSAGLWTVYSAIYGLKGAVKAYESEVKRRLGHLGELDFFTTSKISQTKQYLDWLIAMDPYTFGIASKTVWQARKLVGRSSPDTRQGFTKLRGQLDVYNVMHDMLRGIPPETISTATWRNTKESLGLMWYAPVVEAGRENVQSMLYETEAIYQKYGFEMPVTMNLVTPETITGIFSIHFDLRYQDEIERAHALSHELKTVLPEMGIDSYRLPVQDQSSVVYAPGKTAALRSLKKAFDPNSVIQPGRYGIFG
jgi:4-cresol dehydrogenase (hydroxylating)